MQKNKLCSDKEWLHDQYVTQSKTGNEIAVLAECHFQTVFAWLGRHEITIRRTGAHYKSNELYRDEHWLYEQYVDRRRSTQQIADELSVSAEVVGKWCKRFGFVRPRGHMMEYHFFAPEWDNEEWLRDRYELEEMSQPDIAAVIGVSLSVVQWRFEKYHIQARTDSERSTGEKNPNWRGGTSMLPYPPIWTEAFKRSIRERDRYECAICHALYSMEVHHIDYDKQNTVQENCITLCKRCHGVTNGQRDAWQQRLSGIAREREDAIPRRQI